jgi:3-oxoacyl-[acyl-carrier-protein] synthase II
LNLKTKFTTAELRTMSPATAYALIAAEEALTDANWKPKIEDDKRNTGVAVGIGMIDLIDVCTTYENLKKGYSKISPYFVPRILPNMAAGQISIKYGFKGPNHSVSTACATGAHAIGKFIINLRLI